MAEVTKAVVVDPAKVTLVWMLGFCGIAPNSPKQYSSKSVAMTIVMRMKLINQIRLVQRLMLVTTLLVFF